jgi:hypothetical protein
MATLSLDTAPKLPSGRAKFTLESFSVEPMINNREVVKDRDGKPVLNSAGRTFQSTVQYQSMDLMITVVRKESNFTNATITAYSGKTNASSFTLGGLTIEAETALMFISSDELIGDDVYSYTVTYRIHVANNWFGGVNIGWAVAVLDCGLEYWDAGSPPKLSRAMEEVTKEDGSSYVPVKRIPSASPVHLDGTGKKLPVPLTTENPPTYLIFKPYPTANFGDLNLQRGRKTTANRGVPPVPPRNQDVGGTVVASTTTTTSTSTTTTLP